MLQDEARKNNEQQRQQQQKCLASPVIDQQKHPQQHLMLPPSSAASQTQEILTQNPDATQLGSQEDEDEYSQPLSCYSPAVPRVMPWGRLIPNAGNPSAAMDLMPRAPLKKQKSSATCGGLAHPGLDQSAQPGDRFNEYVIGRSHKCDVIAVNPADATTQHQATATTAVADKHEKSRQTWAFCMISNRHCSIYCTLPSTRIATGVTVVGTAAAAATPEVWIEDNSGNGTVINRHTLLRRGESRILHSGDEICLVNPQTVRKKVRSNQSLQAFLQQFSFVFCSTTVSLHQAAVVARAPRTAAVNVRATRLPGLLDSSLSPHGKIIPAAQQQQQPAARRVELDYDFREVIGSGTVGQVRRAIHRTTGQERAIKIIATPRTNRRQQHLTTNVQAEATILQRLSHPYVVKLIDVYVAPAAVYLVMELLHGGDLFDRIVLKTAYSETDSRRVMRRLLSAIHYLHCQCNIVHRDLKPENILLLHPRQPCHGSSDGVRDSTTASTAAIDMTDITVKLTDFGLAKSLEGVQGLKTFCGTPLYFAPEVLQRRGTVAGRGRYGQPADMWSLGVILYVLLTGTPPFDEDHGGGDGGAFGNHSNGPQSTSDGGAYALDWSTSASVSDAARDLVRRLLMTDPQQRLTVVEACEHPWILTDDGDTHVHPLDDPALKQQQQVNKEEEDHQTKTATGANKDSGTPVLVQDGAIDGDNCSSGDTDTTDVGCLDNKLPSTSSELSPANAEVPISGDGSRESSPYRQPSGIQASSPRRPLSPVQLNNDHTSPPTEDGGGVTVMKVFSKHSDQEQALKGSSADDAATKAVSATKEHQQRQGMPSCNLGTPAVSNRSPVGRVSDEMRSTAAAELGGGGLELSDDEVYSNFSEKTESISSFTSTTADVLSDEGLHPPIIGSIASHQQQQKLEDETTTAGGGTPKDGRAVARTRKRRVTDHTTTGDSLSRVGFSKKKKKTATPRGRHPGKNKAIEGTGKQATISQWFRKKE